QTRSLSPTASEDDIEELVAGNTAFALELYDAVNDAEGNLFLSPYSISVALGMTYAGALGDTESQMADTLHFNLTQDRLHPAFNKLDLELASRGEDAEGKDEEPFRLHIVNQLWGQEDYEFLPDFLDTLAVNYGAGLRLMDFESVPDSSRIEINEWVADQTGQRIKDLVPQGGIDTLTRLVLTNAIYFNAAWDSPFEVANTAEGTFAQLDGTEITVPMMSQEQVYPYVERDNVKAVELPYDGNELSMILLVPEPGTFADFEDTLTSDELNLLIGSLAATNLRLSLPKFEYNAKLSLAQTLAAMGMPAAFATEANFSGMDGTRDLQISDVFHKAFIAVDESGTEAAAATAGVVGTTSIPDEPLVFSIDRPFLFLIRDRKTGAILFLGRVTAPE
ncbi:MAG: serpin family protein, partial [Verrucomicrobiota bacterium]